MFAFKPKERNRLVSELLDLLQTKGVFHGADGLYIHDEKGFYHRLTNDVLFESQLKEAFFRKEKEDGDGACNVGAPEHGHDNRPCL